MTNRDIVVQILSEASYLSAHKVRDLADVIYKNIGTQTKIDDVVPEKQAEQLLARLRNELPGIRQWLIKGNFLAESDLNLLKSRMH